MISLVYFVVTVDASEAGKGVVMIDSDLPVVTYDKIEERKYAVSTANEIVWITSTKLIFIRTRYALSLMCPESMGDEIDMRQYPVVA